MASGRLDWMPGSADRVTLRYAFQHSSDTGASSLDRAIGSATYRQKSTNEAHSGLVSWTHTLSQSSTNSFRFAVSDFDNTTDPTNPGIQYTFPSMLDGASFRVPQATTQRRYQFDDTVSVLLGNHSLKVGAEYQKISANFGLGVFRQGRIEFVQDFPEFDLNGDGRVDDNDLLFAVTLRSSKPDQDLNLDNQDNSHFAGFVQDDWRIHPQFTINAGVRYEVDTDVKNVSGYDQVNPIVKPFYVGDRKRDGNNFGPRIGFNWASKDARTSIHGGYGIYYDRVTLEIVSLERGLDGRSLVVEVRAGNVFFLGPQGPAPGRAHRSRTPSPASSCRGPEPRGSTSSTTGCRIPRCSSSTSGSSDRLDGTSSCGPTPSTTSGRTSSSAGPSGPCTTPWWEGPTPS